MYLIKNSFITLGGSIGGFYIDFGLSFFIAFIEFKNSWKNRKSKKESTDEETDETVARLVEFVSKKEEKIHYKIAKIILYYLGKIAIFGLLILWLALFNWEKIGLFTPKQLAILVVVVLPIVIFVLNFNYCLDCMYKNQNILKNADILSLISLFFLFSYEMEFGTIIVTLIGFIFSILIVVNYIYYHRIKKSEKEKYSSFNIRVLGKGINSKRLVWFSSFTLIFASYASLGSLKLVVYQGGFFILIVLAVLFLKLVLNNISAVTEAKDSKLVNEIIISFNKKILISCVILQLVFIHSIIYKIVNPWISYIIIILLLFSEISLFYETQKRRKRQNNL